MTTTSSRRRSSGSNVVWEDSRNAETDGTDVYTWDTGTAKRIAARRRER